MWCCCGICAVPDRPQTHQLLQHFCSACCMLLVRFCFWDSSKAKISRSLGAVGQLVQGNCCITQQDWVLSEGLAQSALPRFGKHESQGQQRCCCAGVLSTHKLTHRGKGSRPMRLVLQMEHPGLLPGACPGFQARCRFWSAPRSCCLLVRCELGCQELR